MVQYEDGEPMQSAMSCQSFLESIEEGSMRPVPDESSPSGISPGLVASTPSPGSVESAPPESTVTPIETLVLEMENALHRFGLYQGQELAGNERFLHWIATAPVWLPPQAYGTGSGLNEQLQLANGWQLLGFSGQQAQAEGTTTRANR